MTDENRATMIADMIGQQRAELNELKQTLKYWEDLAKESGEPVLEGNLFRVSVVQSNRKTVNWKAVAEKLGPSRQLITANSTTVIPRVRGIICRSRRRM